VPLPFGWHSVAKFGRSLFNHAR